jgi:hypothetical protein
MHLFIYFNLYLPMSLDYEHKELLEFVYVQTFKRSFKAFRT